MNARGLFGGRAVSGAADSGGHGRDHQRPEWSVHTAPARPRAGPGPRVAADRLVGEPLYQSLRGLRRISRVARKIRTYVSWSRTPPRPASRPTRGSARCTAGSLVSRQADAAPARAIHSLRRRPSARSDHAAVRADREKRRDSAASRARNRATLGTCPPTSCALLSEACLFTDTLVDRIVTGYPRDEAAALSERSATRTRCSSPARASTPG